MENNSCCQSTGKGKIFIWTLIILGVISLGVLAILRDAITNKSQYQVSVVGRGQLAYQPDTAIITLGVQVDKAPSAETALLALNEKMNNVVKALKALGLGEETIQTKAYSLYPLYEYREDVSTTTGFSANQQLTVNLKDIKLTSRVLSEASKAGANQVIGVSFELSNLEELKQEARLLAIKDAKSKASSLAQAAGVSLGEIIGWWENYLQGPGTYNAGNYEKGMGGEALSSPNIPVGNQELIIEMNLNYKVK